jgi:hypothetical protein
MREIGAVTWRGITPKGISYLRNRSTGHFGITNNIKNWWMELLGGNLMCLFQ